MVQLKEKEKKEKKKLPCVGMLHCVLALMVLHACGT